MLDAAYLDSRRDENGTSYLEAARAGEARHFPDCSACSFSWPERSHNSRGCLWWLGCQSIGALCLPSAAAGYGAASYEEMLQGARRTPADLAAFVELHIEQVGGAGWKMPGSAIERLVQGCLAWAGAGACGNL